jgi:hypothetical protein
MVTLRVISVYLLELRNVAFVNLVESIILPIFRGFAVPSKGVVDLNKPLATKRAGIVHQPYKSRNEGN